MVYADRFLDDASRVWSGRLRIALANILANVEAFPDIGSRNVPASIKKEFGEGVRKVACEPFDVVYEYDEASDAVFIYALIPMRSAR